MCSNDKANCWKRRSFSLILAALLCGHVSSLVWAQPPEQLPMPPISGESYTFPMVESQQNEAELIGEVIEPELSFSIDPTRSLLVRTKQQVTRVSISHPDILDVTQFGPS